MSSGKERKWPPDPNLTEDQKKRYGNMLNNLAMPQALLYNEMVILSQKLDKILALLEKKRQ